MSTIEKFTKWTGTATFNDAVYRLTVIAPSNVWQSDVVTAIRTAGGYNEQISRADDDSIAPYGEAQYSVTFTPDSRLTSYAKSKPTTTFLLRDKKTLLTPNGVADDLVGELMQRAGAFRPPKSNPVSRCPTCGSPGFRGNACKCGSVIYLKR
ncbi:hypothetical protein KKB44_02050 [Candidatus Micrarchaeota archaeon]|nr:hypothetical protein [Candidatus Micrarchaeota archaeon]